MCLEAAAIRKGIVARKPTSHDQLEWLDIEGLTERLLRNINLDEWSSLKEETGGERKKDPKDITGQEGSYTDNPVTGRDHITPKPSDDETKQIVDEAEEETRRGAKKKTSNLTKEQRPAARDSTPKRKLSPMATTPLRKTKNRSTAIFGSPILRERLVTLGDEEELQGPQAPDLIEGIGLLRKREGKVEEVTVGRDLDPRPKPLIRIVGTPRGRLGSDSTVMRNRSKPRTARRRAGSLSHLITSPTCQRRITDIFKAQMKNAIEGKDDADEQFLKKQNM